MVSSERELGRSRIESGSKGRFFGYRCFPQSMPTKPQLPRSTASASGPDKELARGLPRFLSKVVEHALQTGLRKPEDFLRHFSTRTIMRSLAAEPERRGRILEATTGLRSLIASKKSPESSAEDMQIALDERLTDPATVVSLFTPDDRVRFLDPQMLWAFVIEPGYGAGSVELGEQIPEIREHTAFIIENALEQGLINHHDVISAISINTLVDRLPRSELASVFERVLEEGREGLAFTEEMLFQMIPMPVIVAHVPLATLWNWVIDAKIAIPAGLMPEPTPLSEDEALFDEREAHPDAGHPSKDVTVIIESDGESTPADDPRLLRSMGGRSA